MACDHITPRWSITDCNEDGWMCEDCTAPLGFRPDLDRKLTREKVDVILFWLHEHKFIYVSNASEGDSVVSQVSKLCRAADEYDQQTIVYLIAALGRESHAKFWREQAKQAQCGHPSRTLKSGSWVCDRCGQEEQDKGEDDLPLFASKEPF